MRILIMSAACCYPGMAAFDEQAKKVIEQAIKETGVEAKVEKITGSTAIYGGVLPKDVMKNLMNEFSRGEVGPAVLINGEVIACGVPQLEDIKTKIIEFSKNEK